MLRLSLLFVLCAFVATSIFAQDFAKNYKYKDFDQAEKAGEFLRFDMKSTKLGFITTSFTGFTKEFSITGVKDGEVLKNIKIAFNISMLDTDIDSRNEKMWEQCLDYKKHPQIVVAFKKEVPIVSSSPVAVPAIMTIRGVEKNITVVVNTKKVNGKFFATGVAEVKLTSLGIPDPSIIIASVDDNVKISFNISE